MAQQTRIGRRIGQLNSRRRAWRARGGACAGWSVWWWRTRRERERGRKEEEEEGSLSPSSCCRLPCITNSPLSIPNSRPDDPPISATARTYHVMPPVYRAARPPAAPVTPPPPILSSFGGASACLSFVSHGKRAFGRCCRGAHGASSSCRLSAGVVSGRADKSRLSLSLFHGRAPSQVILWLRCFGWRARVKHPPLGSNARAAEM